MHLSRDRVAAALSLTGGLRIEALAQSTLARAGVGRDAPGIRLAVELGYPIRAVTRATFTADVVDLEIDGRIRPTIFFAYPDESGFNVTVGVAIGELRAAGIEVTEANVHRLVKALRRRRSESGSGMFPAVQ